MNMIGKNQEEIQQQPRVGTEYMLGNLLQNRIARSRRVKFKLKHPGKKKTRESDYNPDVSGYGRPFVLSPEHDVAKTDTGLIAVIYEMSKHRDIDFTRYDLKLATNTKVVIVGFDM
jgi:hypothetical protein